MVGEATNGREAVARCEADPVDLVLMDIQMPGMDGLEAARRIAQMPVPPAVIFTTAYAEHALPAFEVNGAGYLLKAIRPEKLKEALEKVTQVTRPLLGREEIHARNSGSRRVSGETWSGSPFPRSTIYVPLSKCVVVRHEGGEALIEESLKQLEKRFGERLLRVHRNALVVPERIAGLERGPEGSMGLVFDGIDDRIEVSRRHLPQVRRLLRATAS